MKAWYEAYRDGVIRVRFKVETMLSKQYVFFNTMKLDILNYLAQYNFGTW